MKQALRQGHLRDPEHLLPDGPGGQHPGEVHAAIKRRRRAGHGVHLRQRRAQRPGRHDAQRCGGGVQRGQDGGATRRATDSGCCSSSRGAAAVARAISLPIRPSSAPAPMGVRRARLGIAVRGLRGWMRCLIIWIIVPMRVIPCLRLCSRRGWRVCGGSICGEYVGMYREGK